MNNKNLVTGVFVLGGIAAIYFTLIKPMIWTKSKAAKIILKNGYYRSGMDNLLSFDDGYVIAWGKAAKKLEETFTYKGTVYETQGGKIKN
jgi:hypothetical protein